MKPQTEYGGPELPSANKERPQNEDMEIQEAQLYVTEDCPNPETIKNPLLHDLPVIQAPQMDSNHLPLPNLGSPQKKRQRQEVMSGSLKNDTVIIRATMSPTSSRVDSETKVKMPSPVI